MRKRTLSSIFLWGTLLGSVYYFQKSAIVTWIVLVSLFSQIELSKILRAAGLNAWSSFDTWIAVVFPVTLWFIPLTAQVLGSVYLTFLMIICLSAVVKTKNALSLISSLFSFWYIPFNLHFLILFARTAHTNFSTSTLFWIVAVTKMTDIGGLIIGSTLGKHHLALDVSPQKTWEGVVGGILLACMAGLLIPCCFHNFTTLSYFQKITFSCILAAGAVVSDLIESLLKRQSRQKDSGGLIPGIGGILDLVDSLLLNAPIGYFLIKYCSI
ncbi:MAG: phosphatidate cytidylyltransferase [Puniceicoccales bacterium]|jgi:phosphatidate cytidylyltransferase|nr:phosphatidate cytidylyltransferase [Puniceicoccales bacterium]